MLAMNKKSINVYSNCLQPKAGGVQLMLVLYSIVQWRDGFSTETGWIRAFIRKPSVKEEGKKTGEWGKEKKATERKEKEGERGGEASG
jgi:hypothetical protein